MDSKFIAITLESYIREDISRTIATLRSLLHAKHDHWASHYKVWDAKHKAVAAIYGDFGESYAELPRFLAVLKDADPTTVTQLKCDHRGVPGTCTFNCAFWAFGLCIKGFRHCRPVISIDATHLYGKYKGMLLIAMATDANNEVYPLTFAVVENESKETWGWFLACLKRFVTDQTNLCIISDRHLGIKACFDDTTSANQIRKFEAILELIRNVKSAAHRYLEAENKEKWTLAHDRGRRYGAMTTNLSECFNGVLKGARSLPIMAMVRFSFFKVNSYFDTRRNLTLDQLEAGQEWCKYAMDKFEKNQAKAKNHMVTRMCAQAQLYQVDTPGNPLSNRGGQHTYKVDLRGMTCKCGKWEAYKIPCSHSTAGDVHAEESLVDPTTAVADDGDDGVHADSVAAEPTVPPPLSLRAMMETFMTTQAAHGQLLDGLIAGVATLRVDFSENMSAFPPPPPSDS
ncbi:uncharacterized protein LOC115967357 [Quercus lobata]|uniref:uncharacterized protein LOC115967357 n=1 Tax=Quercus lobata TaxID=97700 RepID=UPI001248EBB8|nr:uncharacterized protein LOC115967357 [Quercus lobata]